MKLLCWDSLHSSQPTKCSIFDLAKYSQNRSIRYPMVSEELLAILACPACKGSLDADYEAQKLLCQSCGMEFPVRAGIPILLIDEAERIS